MKNNGILIDVWILFLFAILFTNCSFDEKESSSEVDAALKLTLSTRSSIPSVEELGDGGIKKTRVIVFRENGSLELNKVFSDDNAGRVDNPVFSVSPGLKDIYVIANEDGKEARSGLLPNVLDAIKTKDELENLAIKTQVENAVPKTGLLMAGHQEVNAKRGYSKLNPLITEIPVERLSSKLTIKVQKNWQEGTEKIDVRISKVEIINGMDAEYLIAKERTGGYYPNGTDIINRQDLKIEEKTVTNKQISSTQNNYEDLGVFYPTTRIGDFTDGTRQNAMNVAITFTVNGEQKMQIVNISKLQNKYNIARNTHYELDLTVWSSWMDISLAIVPWETVDVTGDIVDENNVIYTSSSEIKMDSRNLGNSFDAHFRVSSDRADVTFLGYFIDGTEVQDRTQLPKWLTIVSSPDRMATLRKNTDVGVFDFKYTPVRGVYKQDPDPAAGANSEFKDVYLHFKAGNLIKKVKILYDNGVIPASVLEAQGWTNPPSKGIEVLPLYHLDGNEDNNLVYDSYRGVGIWPVDIGDVRKKFDQKYYKADYNSGPTNTDYAARLLFKPALIIRKYGTRWYIPSEKELVAILKEGYLYLGKKYKLRWQYYNYVGEADHIIYYADKGGFYGQSYYKDYLRCFGIANIE